jgi:hypothetical protein
MGSSALWRTQAGFSSGDLPDETGGLAVLRSREAALGFVLRDNRPFDQPGYQQKPATTKRSPPGLKPRLRDTL